jgi:hypothetical protein
MQRAWLVFALLTLLGGCGLAGTGAASGAAAQSAAQQAAAARETEDQVKRQLDAAGQQAADRRRAGEADGQ